MIEIKHKNAGNVLKVVDADSLSGADLYGADLYGADLRGADLSGAYLYGADLSGADLSGANLYQADLYKADLTGANLHGANLYQANLSEADLSGADLRGATLPDNTKFEKYLAESVPALLTAGGKTLTEVLSTGCWKCHSWENCPMHAAFGISSVQGAPEPLRERVELFVTLFDARALPEPSISRNIEAHE